MIRSCVSRTMDGWTPSSTRIPCPPPTRHSTRPLPTSTARTSGATTTHNLRKKMCLYRLFQKCVFFYFFLKVSDFTTPCLSASILVIQQPIAVELFTFVDSLKLQRLKPKTKEKGKKRGNLLKKSYGIKEERTKGTH